MTLWPDTSCVHTDLASRGDVLLNAAIWNRTAHAHRNGLHYTLIPFNCFAYTISNACLYSNWRLKKSFQISKSQKFCEILSPAPAAYLGSSSQSKSSVFFFSQKQSSVRSVTRFSRLLAYCSIRSIMLSSTSRIVWMLTSLDASGLEILLYTARVTV